MRLSQRYQLKPNYLENITGCYCMGKLLKELGCFYLEDGCGEQISCNFFLLSTYLTLWLVYLFWFIFFEALDLLESGYVSSFYDQCLSFMLWPPIYVISHMTSFDYSLGVHKGSYCLRLRWFCIVIQTFKFFCFYLFFFPTSLTPLSPVSLFLSVTDEVI